ncbi:dipeptidase [Actinomadura sp. LOL_011]|uniref:dipeptidase n=1 Tax=Actinomadura sp. LOL_011 TaxID=3345410 RepID=UPI003A80931E
MYIDGLNCSRMTRDQLVTLRRARIDAVTTTCGFWEDATESLDAVANWRHFAEDNADLVGIARTAGDVRRLAAEGRTALILGFQNSSMLQGRLAYVDFFAEVGVRVVQLTYNIQNDIGGSCYEPVDSGLTRFGHEVVERMNRAGIVIDLSHVGNRTTLDAIHASGRPVAITHANCSDITDHPRNKPREVLEAMAEGGGVIGVTTYHNLTRGFIDTPAAWSEMVARTVDIAGAAHVGIGTDANVGGTDEYRAWMRSGRWSRRPQEGAGLATGAASSGPPSWFRGPGDFAVLDEALRARGFSAEEVAGLMGGNWLRFYDEVLGVPEPAGPATREPALTSGGR